MSLKKRDRSEDKQGSEQESKREKRRRQRDAARRQKALAETERKRRKETEKDEAKPDAKKPAGVAAKKPVGVAAKKPAGVAAKKPADSEKPRSERKLSDRAGTAARKLGGGVVAVGSEVLKLAREMLVIPLQLWLGLAELVGGVVLVAWRRVVAPGLRLLWRLLVGLLHFGERHVTPARALGVVALVAIGVLVASQWRDYSAVSVGVDAYAGDVGAVAPAPEVSSAPAHEAHGPVMVILAALALVALAGAFAKRRRLSVWLVAIGVAVLAISLLVDAPKGLDEGDAAVAYESASSALLSGFWLQIAAGAVLLGCGLLLPRALRPAPAAAPTGAQPGPSIFDGLVARARAVAARRRGRPKATRRARMPLRRTT